MIRYPLKALCLALVLVFPVGIAASSISSLVISEVLFNPSGNDNGKEWVELFNGTGGDIDLSAYSLGWGGSNYTTGTAQLSGIIAPDGYFVIGGPNGGVTYDLVYDFSPNLENANGSVADGIALFDVLAISLTPSTVPIDSVIYAREFATNASGLMDETGGVGAIEVQPLTGGNSGFFRVDAAVWQIHDASNPPTAGGGGLAAPEAKTSTMLALGLAMLAIGGRRRDVRP